MSFNNLSCDTTSKYADPLDEDSGFYIHIHIHIHIADSKPETMNYERGWMKGC